MLTCAARKIICISWKSLYFGTVLPVTAVPFSTKSTAKTNEEGKSEQLQQKLTHTEDLKHVGLLTRGWRFISKPLHGGKTAEASVRLYYQCANGIDFLKFIETFKLEDNFASWFKITSLHVWFLLVRFSNEKEFYSDMRHRIVVLMWQDAEKRLKSLPSVNYAIRRRTLTECYSYLFSCILWFDEGLLGDDRDLASAVWSLFYNQKLEDPLILNQMVRYIRQQVWDLYQIDSDKLLEEGVTWGFQKEKER